MWTRAKLNENNNFIELMKIAEQTQNIVEQPDRTKLKIQQKPQTSHQCYPNAEQTWRCGGLAWAFSIIGNEQETQWHLKNNEHGKRIRNRKEEQWTRKALEKKGKQRKEKKDKKEKEGKENKKMKEI